MTTTRARRSDDGRWGPEWLLLEVSTMEFHPGHGLRFVSMERELSELLQGRRVDMVTPKFLNPRIRDQVLRTAEPLYVAA